MQYGRSSRRQSNIYGGLMSGPQMVGNYYAGPSPLASGVASFTDNFLNTYNDMSDRQAYEKQLAEAKAHQDRMYGLQEQQLQWEKDKVAKKDAHEKNVGRATIYMMQNPNPTPEQVAEYAGQWGHSPLEIADHNSIAKFMEGRENRQMRLDIAHDNNELRRDIASTRVGDSSPKYQMVQVIDPETGLPTVVAIDQRNPSAPPVQIGRVPPKGGGGATGQAGMLPLDTAARKSLADWNAMAADAARVGGELDKAMGAQIDPKTGAKTYPQQPTSTLSGGTGLILGSLPDRYAARLDPEGVPLRSALSNFSSQIMNALSGAAVSAQEKKRLEGFLPTTSDDWNTLRAKMDGYRGFLRSKGDAWRMSYGDHEALARGMNALGGAQQQGRAQGDTPALGGGAANDPLGLRGGK